MKQLRVCVIGAGGSGLAAVRHLTSEPDVFVVSVFEQASCIGGMWVFSEKTGSDEHGLAVHSSIYRNLRTNLPKQVMAFPDFPSPSEWMSFMSHQQVLKYLEDYATHFDLRKHIHFNSIVTSVRPLIGEDSRRPQWEVVVSNVDTSESQIFHFEAVIVCNGHNSVPLVPTIPGLGSFPGLVMHSHDYRSPEVFQGKTVVILGAGASGQDISLQVARSAETVYLSHEGTLLSKLPNNVEQRSRVKSVSKDGKVLFNDGEAKKVDAVLLCTGYKISLPFLDKDCHIQVRNNRVTHLYKHIFNTKYPTLSFIGLCSKFCIFPHFSLQAQYIAAVLSGRKKLPSEEEMNADEESEFKKKLALGLRENHAHQLGCSKGEVDYERTIARLAGVEALSPVYRELTSHVLNRRNHFLMDYKNDEFEVTSNCTWTTVERQLTQRK